MQAGGRLQAGPGAGYARRAEASTGPAMPAALETAAYWLQDRLFRALLALAMRMPYERRVPLFGRIAAHLVAPLAGWRKRIRANLALVRPDLAPAEVERLVRAVPDSFGRALIEMYSGAEFMTRAARAPVSGEGLAAFEAARAEGRATLLVTAHLGNYLAARAALAARGTLVAGLYRPMNNPFFNTHYVAALEALGKPLFPRGRHGLAAMLRHLREGGALGILIDQHVSRGAPLTFFGRTAYTALSAAEMALKFRAVMIPVYAIRQPDGLGFEVVLEAPVPHSTPEAMTQALNDSLEAQVRAHMEQWIWMHRRWRAPKDHRGARAAASTGP
jgi:KDO2-lipid IV(A) lauroyltransferase